eukprot:SAG31_NODE_6141_length_2152_cov_1.026790_3_plen_191_part_00
MLWQFIQHNNGIKTPKSMRHTMLSNESESSATNDWNIGQCSSKFGVSLLRSYVSSFLQRDHPSQACAYLNYSASVYSYQNGIEVNIPPNFGGVAFGCPHPPERAVVDLVRSADRKRVTVSRTFRMSPVAKFALLLKFRRLAIAVHSSMHAARRSKPRHRSPQIAATIWRVPPPQLISSHQLSESASLKVV